MERGLRYRWSMLKSRFIASRWYKAYSRIEAYVEFKKAFRILRKKGHGEVHSLVILKRWVKMKKHLTKKSSRDAMKELYTIIAEVSEATGIPQWELRAMIEEDFHLDT